MSFDEWKERQESLGNEVDSWSAWVFQQDKIDELQKRIDECQKLTKSIRAEFDLWADDSEFSGIVEAQICMFENILNGEK